MALYFGKIRDVFLFRHSLFLRVAVYFILVLSLANTLYGQYRPFTSAYNAGLLSSDRFDATSDAAVLQPSILPDVPGLGVSAQIQSRYSGFDIFSFGLHMTSALPGNFGVGLSILTLGHADYNRSEVGFSAGKKLSAKWGIGVSQRFLRTRVGNEGRPWSGHASAAASYDAGAWGVALHLTGLMPWNKTLSANVFDVHLATYFQWETRTTLYGLLGYSKTEWVPVIGIRQPVLEDAEVFGAFRIYPARYSVGFTLPLSRSLQSIVSTQYHPVLGWSPALGLRWRRARVNP